LETLLSLIHFDLDHAWLRVLVSPTTQHQWFNHLHVYLWDNQVIFYLGSFVIRSCFARTYHTLVQHVLRETLQALDFEFTR
jgi:hypothetical protein